MLARISVIALNTYREAVRGRVLHGLFGLAVAAAGYTLVVGAFAAQSRMRVVSDLGAMSVSFFGIVVAVVLAGSSLYRELELKTIFPILTRPLRRSEYLVGKFFGTVLTLAVFIAANTGLLLLAVAHLGGRPFGVVLAAGAGSIVVAGVVAWRMRTWRTYVPVGWAIAVLILGSVLATDVSDDRRVLVGSAVLTLSEVGVVAAIATLFASFSSPFLTAVFTFGVFVVGRSADTLANLPHTVFGQAIKDLGALLARVVPNLMVYAPPRSLLTGEAVGTPLGQYTLMAVGHAVLWCAGLLAVSSLVFSRRDFH